MNVSCKYPGPRFNIKMTSYWYRKSHCGDKTILRPSYLHNGISYTGKTTSLYWIGALEWDTNSSSGCSKIDVKHVQCYHYHWYREKLSFTPPKTSCQKIFDTKHAFLRHCFPIFPSISFVYPSNVTACLDIAIMFVSHLLYKVSSQVPSCKSPRYLKVSVPQDINRLQTKKTKDENKSQFAFTERANL